MGADLAMGTKDTASSPSAVAAVGSDKNGLPDDGQIAPAKAALARESVALFQSRRYGECQDVLSQLIEKYGDDPEVLHNIAVAQYFKDGGTDPKKLLHMLSEVEKRGADICTAQLQRDTSEALDSNYVIGSGISPNISSMKVATACGAGNAIVRLNKAVILYHLHEYVHASSLLEPLFRNLETVDERIAIKVCLLLIDTALALQDFEKAANVIQYMENAFAAQTVMPRADNGFVSLHSSSQAVTVSSTTSGSAAADFVSELSANVNTSDQPSGRATDDTTAYESLITTLDGSNGGRDLSASDEHSRIFSRRPATAFDPKAKLQLCKVRVLLARDLNAAKSEIKQIKGNLQGRDAIIAFFLGLHLEYVHGNYQKAADHIMAYENKQETQFADVLYNNLGCLYHQLKKHHLSAVLFSKALRSSAVLSSDRPLKLATFSQDKSNLITYNCGLQYLACGKPLPAARCFYEASAVLSKQPILWLRFAECCLLALQQGMLQSPIPSCSKFAEVSIVGSGKMRQLFLNSNSSNRTAGMTSQDGLISDLHKCRLSLPFARQCLLNALFLLDKNDTRSFRTGPESFDDAVDINNLNQKSSDCLTARSSNASRSTSLQTSAIAVSEESVDSLNLTCIQSSVFEFQESVREQTHLAKQAVLADLAYIELCLENPLRALGAARRIQQLPGCSRVYDFLSRVYSAEALCRLNYLNEAAEQLSAYLSEDISMELCYRKNISERSDKKFDSTWMTKEHMVGVPLSSEEARGLLYVNLAAVFAMQGDLNQADHYIREAITLIPNNPRAIVSAVYLDLRLGRAENALSKLRWCSQVVFVRTSSKSSGSL